MDFDYRNILPDINPKIDSTMMEANKNAVQQRQAILDTADAIKDLNSKIEDIQADSAKQSKSSKRWNIAVFVVALLTLIATVAIGLVQLLR